MAHQAGEIAGRMPLHEMIESLPADMTGRAGDEYLGQAIFLSEVNVAERSSVRTKRVVRGTDFQLFSFQVNGRWRSGT
jgi:hypothetical protein